MINQYRKKPVRIEAVQFTRNNWDEVVSFTKNTAHTLMIERCINGIATCVIPTLEGQHIATENDFIIKGIHGEFYPCKPDIFEKTYELVGDEEEAMYKKKKAIKEAFKDGDWVFGIGPHEGCSQVFTGSSGDFQPFDYLNDYDPTHFRIATDKEIDEAKNKIK